MNVGIRVKYTIEEKAFICVERTVKNRHKESNWQLLPRGN
jgi:hypothetical protein